MVEVVVVSAVTSGSVGSVVPENGPGSPPIATVSGTPTSRGSTDSPAPQAASANVSAPAIAELRHRPSAVIAPH